MISFLVFLLAYALIRFIMPEDGEIFAMFFISVGFFLLHMSLKYKT